MKIKPVYVVIIVIVIIIAILVGIFIYERTHREGYPDIVPDACIEMMERGFNRAVTNACANYSYRCDDQKSYKAPIVQEEVDKLYSDLGGNPGVQDDLYIQRFNNDECLKLQI